jgi:glycosyltransferase involved in cell wall biosynthesis
LPTLNLFTQRFPYRGGETFLETEIHYLAEAFEKVYIFSLEKGTEYTIRLPENVFVKEIPQQAGEPLRKLVLKHFWILTGYFLRAFIRSKHRFKYITQFSYNWNHLMGILNLSNSVTLHFKNCVEPQVYYSYWFNEWASALAICRQKGIKGKYIIRAHGYDYDELQNGRGYFPFRESEIKQFDNIVHISAYGKHKMQQQYADAKNILLSRLGVAENKVNKGGDAIYQLVSCSNFVSLKRLTLIIDTLSKLNIPFYWKHFGDGPERLAIEQYAHQKLPKDSFEFMGYVPNAEMLNYYKNNPVDLFINMSEIEGIPVSMMEAIAAGIPLVGCNVCGVPEIVTQQTGVLLPKEVEPEAAAIKIAQFLKDKARDGNFRIGVQQFQQQYFNAEHNYKKFIEAHLLNA